MLSTPTIAGSTVAFISEGDLWLVNGVAPPSVPSSQPLVPWRLECSGRARAPLLSPDGAWVAYHRWSPDASEVFVVATCGGEPRRLTYLGGISSVVGWSRDSNLVR